MRIVSIVLARGGSKRLPRKNVLPFCGRPLVEWSLIQGICSHRVGRENTYLSTDDDEIAAIGERNGVTVIRRPKWMQKDKYAASIPMIHAIKWIRKRGPLDLCFTTLPTSPLQLPDDLDRAVSRYEELKPIFPDCGEVTFTIPLREIALWKYLDNARMTRWMFNKDSYFAQQGVHSHLYEPDYYLRTCADEDLDSKPDTSSTWMKPGQSGRCRYYVDAQWFQQFDIDYQDQFELCEILMERYILKGRGADVYFDYKKGEGGGF